MPIAAPIRGRNRAAARPARAARRRGPAAPISAITRQRQPEQASIALRIGATLAARPRDSICATPENPGGLAGNAG